MSKKIWWIIAIIILITLILGYFFYPLCGLKRLGSEKNGCKCTIIGAQFCESSSKIEKIDDNAKNEINNLFRNNSGS